MTIALLNLHKILVMKKYYLALITILLFTCLASPISAQIINQRSIHFLFGKAYILLDLPDQYVVLTERVLLSDGSKPRPTKLSTITTKRLVYPAGKEILAVSEEFIPSLTQVVIDGTEDSWVAWLDDFCRDREEKNTEVSTDSLAFASSSPIQGKLFYFMPAQYETVHERVWMTLSGSAGYADISTKRLLMPAGTQVKEISEEYVRRMSH